MRSPHLLIATVTTALIILIACVARVPTYHVAPLFLIPATWGFYFLRRPIFLHPVHYALVCLAILVHMIGAFGFYQESPLPFSYDIFVHFYFAFAATFAVHRFIAMRFPLDRWAVRVGTLMFLMGCGAIHE